MITQLKDDLFVEDRIHLLRIIFYLELVVKKGIRLSLNELGILSLFEDEEDKEKVITLGLEKEFVNSKQSGENTVSKLVKLNILNKVGTHKRKISKEHLSGKLENLIYSTFTIHNLNASKD
jgi:hypothetical protein